MKVKRRRKTKAQIVKDNAQAARIQRYLPTLETRCQQMVLDLEELDRLIADERELRVAYLETEAP